MEKEGRGNDWDKSHLDHLNTKGPFCSIHLYLVARSN